MKRLINTLLYIALFCGAHAFAEENDVVSAFKTLTKESVWQEIAEIDLSFKSFHTQGMVKIGKNFYVSAVEVLDPTETFGKSDHIFDFSITRTPGKGRGWLFKFGDDGKLITKTELTDGNIFHPGGIDFDGTHIWVPVAEYRPNSKSNIYKIDPNTMEATLSFVVDDHIGAIVRNTAKNTFHGASWGGRRIYQWELDENDAKTSENWHPNPTHYIDYQDCHYQASNQMICGGVQNYISGEDKLILGGLELIDLSGDTPKPIHLVPVSKKVTKDVSLTHNPYWIEADKDNPDTLRFYFMPDVDNVAKLLIYEVEK